MLTRFFAILLLVLRSGTAALLVLLPPTAVFAQQSDTVAFDAWVGFARLKVDASDLPAAAAAWRAAEGVQPLTTDLQKEMFWVLAGFRPSEAREVARVILAADPKADTIREKAIHLASDAGDDNDVNVLANAGLAQNASARWTRALGVSAMHRGDYAKAAEWLRAATIAADQMATDAALLALALSAAGDDAAAVVTWESVPRELWQQNPDWLRSRLHASARAAWCQETKAEVEAWIEEHPDDDASRLVLVSALQRHGDHAGALALAVESPNEVEWLRLRARLAEQARRPEIARLTRRQLALRPEATTADRLSSAEWFRTKGDEVEALSIAHGLVQRPARCSDELVSLLFRMQSNSALSELAALVRKYPQHCPAYHSWTRGLVDKLMAVQRFADASEFVEPLALLTQAREDLEVAGQLRLSNGDPSGAVGILLPLVESGAMTESGLDAAIDALRSVRRSSDAWQLARRRVDSDSLDPARALELAELAIDNGNAAVAEQIAQRVAAGNPSFRSRADSVRGQALLLEADPATAFETLVRIPSDQLDDRGRLALVQAQAAHARAFVDQGAPAQAIDVLTCDTQIDLPRESRAMLARAYADAGRWLDADREYAVMAARADVTPDLFVAWSRIKPEGAARLVILDAGYRRFTTDKMLTLELAAAQQRAGNIERAAALARAVLASDEREAAAWRILIDRIRSEPTGSDTRRLARIPSVYAADAATLIELAERLGAAGASEAASATALGWLSAIEPASPEWTARELARSRLLTSRGHTAAALEIVAALASDPDAPPDVRRLHAQLLGWNGHHAESLNAYDAYLALAPDDVDARREQARVAGWAQQFHRARRLYAAIDKRYPTDSAVHAESEAKRFFYASRWRDAERAYARWLEVEPLNDEAAFEYAETLVAQGRLREAHDVYDRLSPRGRPHEMAHLARRILEERADPSGALNGAYVTSHGYDGQRNLDWSEAVGRVSLPILGDTRQKLELSGSSLTFSNRVFRLPAYAGRAAVTMAYPWGSLDGSFSMTRGARDLANWQGDAAADVRVRHDLTMRVGVARTALLENISTVRDGIASWGPMLSFAFTTPNTEIALSARTGWVAHNLERTAGITVRQRVRRGGDEVRLVAGVNQTTWSETDPRFFSPEAFTRADAGVEWARWLRVPRFRMDRKSSLTFRYVAGVDSRGELYHQPFAQLSLEHDRVAIETQASWIASRVYRSMALHLGIRIGG